MKPKVIFLDWYGTLSDSKFWGHLPATDPELLKIERILFGPLSALIVPWMKGEYSSEQIITKISDRSGIPKGRLLAEFINSTKKMIVDSEVLKIIQHLRAGGKKVVIATDNMDSFTRWTVPALSLRTQFDDILSSFEIKALKKEFTSSGESLFFKDYLTKNFLQPQDCLLIDDSEDKNNQIQNFGIVYLKINQSSDLRQVLSSIIEP